MMAYRTSLHETTGFTPNQLMLGREVSTPLDIMYEMPRSFKYTPKNKWAWQLKENMETAHTFVRENMKTAMVRQKKYVGQKLSWQRPGSKAYVFFLFEKQANLRNSQAIGVVLIRYCLSFQTLHTKLIADQEEGHK